MSDFKIGDKVMRVKGRYNRMEIGMTDIIVDIAHGNLYLKKNGIGHSPSNFKKVAITNWRKELQ